MLKSPTIAAHLGTTSCKVVLRPMIMLVVMSSRIDAATNAGDVLTCDQTLLDAPLTGTAQARMTAVAAMG